MTEREKEIVVAFLAAASEKVETIKMELPVSCVHVMIAALTPVCDRGRTLLEGLPPIVRTTMLANQEKSLPLLGPHVARGLLVEKMVGAGLMKERARDEIGMGPVVRVMELIDGEEPESSGGRKHKHCDECGKCDNGGVFVQEVGGDYEQ